MSIHNPKGEMSWVLNFDVKDPSSLHSNVGHSHQLIVKNAIIPPCVAL